MSKTQRKIKERYFTIQTPRKDSSVLDSFLDEFGYKPFENEDCELSSNRSVIQLSTNAELIDELADFCRENGCTVNLIYKEGNKILSKRFAGKTVYNAKEYQKDDIVVEKEVAHSEITNFILNKQQQNINNSTKNQNSSNNKNSHQKNNKNRQERPSGQDSNKNNRRKNFNNKRKPKTIGVMSEKPMKSVSDNTGNESYSNQSSVDKTEVKIIQKKSRVPSNR